MLLRFYIQHSLFVYFDIICVFYAQKVSFQVAQSFLTALQNDERANYQLDVKFQETYLEKVATLLQCQLSEGAVSDNKLEDADENGVDAGRFDEIEEGELPESHGKYFFTLLVVMKFSVHNLYDMPICANTKFANIL